MDMQAERRESCSVSIENCIHSRRCFMTGEYCAKQALIQAEREKLHNVHSINAFVVMNFSNMSDIVYKWRLKNFIESLKKFLYFREKKEQSRREKTEEADGNTGKRLFCFPEKKQDDEKYSYIKVKEINVVRSDSNPSSNFVICNRVCQQMLIADLIIVDVSVENANVFYEFGMAVALGKLILPICYSDSFFEMDKAKLERMIRAGFGGEHIDLFPWRKDLFEYYGIRYKQNKEQTCYLNYSDATNEEYGFRDLIYAHFPYTEEVSVVKDGNEKLIPIGKRIYEILAESYTGKDENDNTVVLYTLDNFLNDEQAGVCIINFFNNIVKAMKKEKCFCGDRVGVLVQANDVPEDTKDAKTKRNLRYSVGEIIFIGVNQATYSAESERVKPEDFMTKEGKEISNGIWANDIVLFTRAHIKNKAMLIHPNRPVYVRRVLSGLQKEILDPTGYDHYCLYHMMLRTLKFTNELVVDISKNTLELLFWLGAAHGADVYTITVRHEQTGEEKALLDEQKTRERTIFDVAGLWTAIFRSQNTDAFYNQLVLAQRGIEQRARLMTEKSIIDMELFKSLNYNTNQENLDKWFEEFRKSIVARREEESFLLESYYQDRFWKSLLRYNMLRVRCPIVTARAEEGAQIDCINYNEERIIASWSSFLSRRRLIGQYQIEPVMIETEGKKVLEINKDNVIDIDIEKKAVPPLSFFILQRTLPKQENENVQFRASISGDSVTSSIEISQLFTEECTEKTQDSKVGRLIDIQKEVRKKFLEKYINDLENELKDKIIEPFFTEEQNAKVDNPEKEKRIYIERVSSTMRLYLSAELYRYFIPFLSKEDEERIITSAKFFIYSLNISHASPFATDFPINSDEDFPTPANNGFIREAMEKTVSILEKNLNIIIGVKVCYQKVGKQYDVELLYEKNEDE